MKRLIQNTTAIAFSLASMTQAMAENDVKGHQQKVDELEGAIVASAVTDHTSKHTSAESKKQGLGLEISGESSANFYAFETKRREENNGKGRGTQVGLDDARLNFEVFGKAMEGLGGLEYSFLIGITGNAEKGENPIQESRIKLKGQWGTFLAGDTRGVTDFMAAGTFFFIGGTGGIWGNYRGVINETTGSVIRDDLGNRFTMKDQTKVIYITPRIFGVQAGYGYTPDGSHKGEQVLESHTPTTSGVKALDGNRFAGFNFHEFAVNYKKNFANCFDVVLSATGLIGRMRNLHRTLIKSTKVSELTKTLYPWPRHNVKAYALGAVFEYAGFSIGGEYLDNLKSGQLRILKGANLGKVSSIGAGYKFGVNAVSLAYAYSKRKLGRVHTPQLKANYGHVKTDLYSLTYDRELAPGLGAYVEGVAFKMKANRPSLLANWEQRNAFDNETVRNNRGQVAITGVRIKF